MNEHTLRQEGQALSRKCIWLRASVFVGLWALLTILFLIPGCGSDSQPGGAVAVKKDKAAKSGTTKALVAALPMNGNEGPGKMGVKKEPEYQGKTVFGMTEPEMAEKAAAARKNFDASHLPALPNITPEELETKIQAARKRFDAEGNREILPGLTREGLDAKVAAAGQRRPKEIVPGLTPEQLEARQRQQVRPDIRELVPPGAK